jgi:Tfp pilus assembly protein PilN
VIRINLLDGAHREPPWLGRLGAGRGAAIGAGLVVIAGLSGGAALYRFHAVRATLSASIEETTAELARLNDRVARLDELRSRERAVSDQLAVRGRLGDDRRQPLETLDAISRSVPDGAWLQEVVLKGPSAHIAGRALSLAVVSEFSRVLAGVVPLGRVVEISAASRESVGQAAFVSFALTVKAAEGTPAVSPGEAIPGAARRATAAGG